MKQMTPLQEFFRYTTLSVLGTLGVSCYILADTFFVSKGLGTNGLAALNLAIPIYNFIHGTGLMLGMGGATRFCICKSQNQKEEVNRIYTNTIYLSIFFSVMFAFTGLLFAQNLSLLRGLILIIPMAFLLSAFYKMTGVWLTYPITEALTALLGYIAYTYSLHPKRSSS